MQQSATSSYISTQVLTASPQKLQLMLIDGAIRFAAQGKAQLEREDFETAGESLIRCQKILAELLANMRASESELARKVAGVYVYLFRTVCEAHLKHDIQKLDDALSVLEVERETWQHVVEKLGAEDGTASAPQEGFDATDSGTAADSPPPSAGSPPLPPLGSVNPDSPSAGGISFEA